MSSLFVLALLVVGSLAATLPPTTPPMDGHMMGPGGHMAPDGHMHHMGPDGNMMGPDPHHGHQNHNGDHMIQGETFMLDTRTNTLMSKTGGKCYLYKLSADEVTNFEHTAKGLHSIEHTVTDMIDAGNVLTALTQEAVHKLDGMVHHFCHHDTIYSLN